MTNLKEQKNNTSQSFFINTLKGKFFERQSYLNKSNCLQSNHSKTKNEHNHFSTSNDNYTQLYPCSECGEVFSIDDMIATQNNNHICYNCYERLYTTCDICSAVIPLSSANNISLGFEDIETCDNCAVQLNTVLKEKEESTVLLHHCTDASSDFIQFSFNIVLQQSLNSNDILNIINSISDICSIYDVPLFYFKKSDSFKILSFTTHFLDLNTNLYKTIIIKLATYIAFEPSILHMESFHLRIECTKDKQDSYLQMMNTLLTSFFYKNSISIKTLESADIIELSTDIIPDILDKANFYRTCLQHF